MKRVLLCFLFLSSIITLNAQERQNIDSLYRIIRSAPTISEKLATYRQVINHHVGHEPKAAKKVLDTMTRLAARDQNNRESQGYLALSKGLYFGTLSNLKESQKNYKNAVRHFEASGSIKNKSLALGNLGISFRRMGDFEAAIEYTIKAIKLKDSLGFKPSYLARDYITLGSIYGDLNRLEDSNKQFEKALKIYKEEGNATFEAHLQNNLGINYSKLENYEVAEQYLLAAKSLYEREGMSFYITTNGLALGNLYKFQKAYSKALPYFEIVVEGGRKVQHSELEARGNKGLGSVYLALEDYEKALPFLQKSLAHNQKAAAYNAMATDYGQLAKIYAALGDYKNAYESSEHHFNMRDSITGRENMERFDELQVKYETSQKEAEIELLNKDLKVKKLGNTLYGIGLVSLLVIASLLYYSFLQKQRKKDLKRSQREAILQQELAFRKKELTSQTLHLVQKNSFIEELTEGIKDLKKAPSDVSKNSKRLLLLLKKEKASEKDWEAFKNYFSEVHESFYSKLKDNSPSITEKEIRLATFLRMNLSTKEIATILNVLPDTILKAKYRLKKKLNLDRSEDLLEFLNTL
ncbi:tetratricopeptide repeat protein [Luteirhabdus pelagi]|uniref:tetratricopeptide repeat protein n=1 Tax=Luteirhabdus pelagi TaxID=2792783 RepID=UPI00193992B5|nr:tetratricopeptide repeat protein [Luteirhabdus pelagi]